MATYVMSPFIEFSFNGINSLSLGTIGKIYRVSGGDFYKESILPTIENKTVQVPGGHGTYYFGSTFKEKTFKIDIAFDDLTEKGMRWLRYGLSDGQIHELVFGEAPYKTYYAKCSKEPDLEYICFEVPNGNTTKRIYKGSGTLEFTAYDPFGYCKNDVKYLTSYVNYDEWSEAAGLLSAKGDYDTYNTSTGKIKLYNPGDFKTDFCLYSNSNTMTKIELCGEELQFDFSEVTSGTKYRINTKNRLIEALDNSYNPTGVLLNKYITSGNFFKIPIITDSDVYMEITDSVLSNTKTIEYDYKYI